MTLQSRLFIAILAAIWANVCYSLDLSSYQNSDGAITVHPQGDYVDPYFAMKALWAARQMGDPAVKETSAWINWLMPHQNTNGSFARFCKQDESWKECDKSDADDSMLAMWIELLYEAAPHHHLPSKWLVSADKAKHALDSLRDPTFGLYFTDYSSKESLLMDNVEVYEALRRVGDIKRMAGDSTGASMYLKQAHDLRLAMINVFYPDSKKILHWSNDDNTNGTFYPYALADLYPWLHKMDTRGFGNMANWHEWLNRYGQTWLSRSGDNYPWGLVALLAWQQRSYQFVKQWISNAIVLRGSKNWNVLEEAVLQGLARVRLERSWG